MFPSPQLDTLASAAICNVAARVTAAPKASVRSTKAQSRAFLGRAAPCARASPPPAPPLAARPCALTAATEDLNKKLKEVTSTVSEKWEETDDKPAVITLGIYALVGLVAANGVLKSIEGLLIPDLLELVGIGFSGFYVYQNLLFKPDRAGPRIPSPSPSTRSSENPMRPPAAPVANARDGEDETYASVRTPV